MTKEISTDAELMSRLLTTQPTPAECLVAAARMEQLATALAAMTKERDEYKRLALAGELIASEQRITEGQLAAERAKVAKLVEALTFYSCKDGCNDCSENERDLIGCGWTARAAIKEAGQ